MKLEFKHVTKRYSEVAAVREVNCVMEQGIYGLLGVNGAGKTTLMRMLCTIIQPSEGEILWNGKEIWKLGSAYREVLGYLPQEFGYYPDLNVYDYMMYISSIKGLKQAFANRRIKQLLEQVDMWKFRKRKMKHLSGGMVRRVGIAQAMLNDPKILVLDEPTAGLDPKERISIRNYIAELSKDKIILFATHVVSDIECIADKVLLLKSGEIIATGTPVELIESMAGKVGEITCTLDEVGELQKEYKIGNIRQRKNGLALRVVGDELPEEAVKVGDNIDLEDVYLYYFE